MAKDAHDREDLLREATAYDLRLEVNLDGFADTIFVGIRNPGACSVYVGQDKVFQFNTQQQLRRAFWRELMLGAYQHQLYWLKRSESPDERVRMTRVPVNSAELNEFLLDVETTLRQLKESLLSSACEIVGQLPEETDVVGDVVAWLARWDLPVSLAQHPGIGQPS